MSHHDESLRIVSETTFEQVNTAEAIALAPIQQLREPRRIQVMVAELQRHLMQLFKENAARSAEVPRELQELGTRLVRLRARLRNGNPVMAPDESQTAFDRAEIKRRQLLAGFNDGEDVAQMLSTALDGSAHGGTLGGADRAGIARGSASM